MESVTKVPQAARQAAETISCAIVFRTVGFYTEFHNVIAAALDQLPVVGDHENGSAAPRLAFQPFRNQAHNSARQDRWVTHQESVSFL